MSDQHLDPTTAYAPAKSNLETRPRERGPQGFKGWLLVLILELVLTTIFKLYQLVNVIRYLLEPKNISDPFAPSPHYYLFVWLNLLDTILIPTAVITSLVVFFLLFTKSRLFKGFYVALQVIAIIYLAAMLYFMAVAISLWRPQTLLYIALIIEAIVLIVYVIRSRRIKNTLS